MKSLIILRGLPGSGKSTLAKVLAGNEWPVFSIDDYFVNDQGEYDFRFAENHLAYKKCEEGVHGAMKKGIEKIFVDNTFTLEWEMEPYFKMAADHGYRVFCATVEHRHNSSNIHGITEEQVKKMAEKYKVVLMHGVQ